MSIHNSGWNASSDNSFVTFSALFGGLATIGLITATVTIANAAPVTTSNAASRDTKTTFKAENLDSNTEASLQVEEPANTYSENSYSESADGSTKTWQYKSSSTTADGNQTTQNQTYETTIDGGNAIDIKLDSTTNTSGASNSGSSSSVHLHSNSTTSITSSQ